MPAPVLDQQRVPGHPDFRALASVQGIDVDLRYASTNNFLGRVLYDDCVVAYLRCTAADALQASVRWLAQQQPRWRLRVLDALRPQRVQETLYRALEGTPQALYLAHPQRGSIHSFGMAVDVTMLDEEGQELDMGSGFDEMSLRSHPEREAEQLVMGALSADQLRHRGWLRAAMRAGGFQPIHSEWWHFDCGDREAVRRDLPRVV